MTLATTVTQERAGGVGVRHSSTRVVLLGLDDAISRTLLSRTIRGMAMRSIEASDGFDVLRQSALCLPDALLVDLHLEGIDGIELCKRLRNNPLTAAIPVVIVSSSQDELVRAAALASGAVRYIIKPFDMQDVGACLRSLADRQVEVPPDPVAAPSPLQAAVSQELRATCRAVINSLGQVDRAGPAWHGLRSERVGHCAAAVAAALGFEPARVELLRKAAALRDVGKLGVPERLLHQPEALSAEDAALLRAHTMIGHLILQHEPASPLTQMAAPIALHHHEWWDGSGYPHGLVADAIPLEARIVAVADAFHELMSGGFSHPARSLEFAIAGIARYRGRRFDPAIVDAFVKALPEILETLSGLPPEGRC